MPNPTPHPRFRTARGFTITELLVVVGIIAVVIGILVPTIKRVTASGRTVKCLSNQRQIMQAWNAYAASNGGRLVNPRTDAGWGQATIQARMDGQNVAPRDMGWTHWWVWAFNGGGHTGLVTINGSTYETLAAITSGALFPYVGSPAVYVSPDDPKETSAASAGTQAARRRSYSINCVLGTSRPNENTNYDAPFMAAMHGQAGDVSVFKTTTLGLVRSPSRMLATLVEDDAAIYNAEGWVIQPDVSVWVDTPAPWRPDAITMSYADGSTGTYALTDRRLAAGWEAKNHNYVQPPDDAAGFAIDWKFFRDRVDPGVLPDSTYGF